MLATQQLEQALIGDGIRPGLWVMYGLAIDAVPVVVANLIVAGAALYSSFRQR